MACPQCHSSGTPTPVLVYPVEYLRERTDPHSDRMLYQFRHRRLIQAGEIFAMLKEIGLMRAIRDNFQDTLNNIDRCITSPKGRSWGS
jgi:hypothetical protein